MNNQDKAINAAPSQDERLNLTNPGASSFRNARVAPPKPSVSYPSRCCVHEFWAVVETNGTLVRGRNVKRVARLANGMYEVEFTDNVTTGVYISTIGRPGMSVEPTGQISVAARAGNPNAVWIDTHDSMGNYSDRAFHLLVMTD